jgi:ABC-type transport system involved in cytochrome c biogenesis permease subunit
LFPYKNMMIKKLVSLFYILIILTLATATIVEHFIGTPATQSAFYGSWWFIGLWAMLVVCGAIYLVSRFRQHTLKAKDWNTLLILMLVLPGTPFRQLLQSPLLRKGLFMLAVCLALAPEAKASGNDMQVNAPVVDKGVAENFGRLFINYNGRICPVQTFALDFTQKIYGNRRYHRLTAEQVLLSWIYFTPEWSNDLFILSLCLRNLAMLACAFGFLLSGFFLLVSHINQMDPAIGHIMPVLNSPLLSIHVSIIIISFALLSLTFICGITGLTLTSHDRELQALSRLFLYPAITTLGMGIFIGAIWANVSWGNYWTWDPKETWALITLLIYAIPLHTQSLPALQRPRTYQLMMVLSFLTIIMTYFGVNYFLSGMHSYA